VAPSRRPETQEEVTNTMTRSTHVLKEAGILHRLTRRGVAARQVAIRRGWFLLVSLAGVFGTFVLVFTLLPDATSIYKDFGQEYVLARSIRDGIDPYQIVRVLGEQYVTSGGFFAKDHPTPHPPTVGLLALPLSYLSYGDAARAWLVIELFCLVASAIVVLRRQRSALFRALALGLVLPLALIAWPPLMLELGLGQLTLPLLLALLCAEWALDGGRSGPGGALIGATLLIKPIAWPVLLLLALRRDCRAVGAAASVVAIGALLSVVAIGLEHSLDYVGRVLPMMSAAFQNEPTNMALWTLGPRLGLPWLGWPLVAGAVVLGCWWSLKRSLSAGLAMMTVVSLLVSPITWYFYLVLALVPLAYVLRVMRGGGLRPVEFGLGAIALVLLSVPQALFSEIDRSGAGAVVFLVPTLGVVMLGLVIARTG
jgi:hypothetical protein